VLDKDAWNENSTAAAKYLQLLQLLQFGPREVGAVHPQQRLHLQALQLGRSAAVAGAQSDVVMAGVHKDQRANDSYTGVGNGGCIRNPFLHRADLLLVIAAAFRKPKPRLRIRQQLGREGGGGGGGESQRRHMTTAHLANRRIASCWGD
jgi:hypothetical protein